MRLRRDEVVEWVIPPLGRFYVSLACFRSFQDGLEQATTASDGVGTASCRSRRVPTGSTALGDGFAELGRRSDEVRRISEPFQTRSLTVSMTKSIDISI